MVSPSLQAQQSLLEAHSVRQTALMHVWLLAQSVLLRHWGRGCAFAWQYPLAQTSRAPHWLSALQAARHPPFTQIWPVAVQSLL
jgi:hypothetical protein